MSTHCKKVVIALLFTVACSSVVKFFSLSEGLVIIPCLFVTVFANILSSASMPSRMCCPPPVAALTELKEHCRAIIWGSMHNTIQSFLPSVFSLIHLLRRKRLGRMMLQQMYFLCPSKRLGSLSMRFMPKLSSSSLE